MDNTKTVVFEEKETRQKRSFFSAVMDSWEKINEGNMIDYILSALTLLGLFGGYYFAHLYPERTGAVSDLMNAFIDGYSFIAPVVIFLILAPCLAHLLSLRRSISFLGYIILCLTVKRILTTFFACIFVYFILSLPLLPQNNLNFGTAFLHVFNTLWDMALHSSYFYAIYLAIAAAFLSMRIPSLENFFTKIVNFIETIGSFFQFLIPPFLFMVGVFIYNLPDELAKLSGAGNKIAIQENLKLAFFDVDKSSDFAILKMYVIGALIVAFICLLFHGFLLAFTKYRVSNFSISTYFRKYWLRVYPLLWATSSEALSTPLNLALVKNLYRNVKNEVRHFVVGIGGWMNIDGTFICVIVMTGLVSKIIGYEVSLLELVFSIPLVCLIGYGVPGIPGELVLFAGPICVFLGVPEALTPSFLALYIGLQFGLPDSFRTGHNSTENCLCAVLLNDSINRRETAQKVKLQEKLQEKSLDTGEAEYVYCIKEQN